MLKATKVELDLYNMKINSHTCTIFQVNISKDHKERYGKRHFSKVQ